MADPADLTAEARDYCQILTEAAEGYPSDIWPDPPEAERPKDAAAAWLLRKMACPIYRESRDLIARLADALDAANEEIAYLKGRLDKRAADADAAIEDRQQLRDALTRYGGHTTPCIEWQAAHPFTGCIARCGWDDTRRRLTDTP